MPSGVLWSPCCVFGPTGDPPRATLYSLRACPTCKKLKNMLVLEDQDGVNLFGRGSACLSFRRSQRKRENGQHCDGGSQEHFRLLRRFVRRKRDVLDTAFQIQIPDQAVQIIWVQAQSLGGVSVVSVGFFDRTQDELLLEVLHRAVILRGGVIGRRVEIENLLGKVFEKQGIA